VVVVGYGYEGHMAVREIIGRGRPAAEVVVVDEKADRVHEAADTGCVGICGDATKDDILRLARVDSASAILVCLPRDDTVALCILTVRNLGSRARLIASAREQENIALLRQAGADEVVAPAKIGGHIMAEAITTPHGLRFITDLLSARGALRIVERQAEQAEVGLRFREVPGHLVVAVERGGATIGFWSSPDEVIRAGDRLFAIKGADDADGSADGAQPAANVPA
jgi:voltage-gated potassium channel